MDVFRISKIIGAPLSYVYKWCTDFSESDPQLTGSKSQRMILEKTLKRAIYAQIYDGADGRKKVAVNVVTLKPPDSWHLDYFGEEDDETAEYRLKSLGRGKTRLDMVFREKWKKIERVPSIEEQIEHTDRAWDKFVVALEGDYNSEKKPRSR
jgi:hypothetical protein